MPVFERVIGIPPQVWKAAKAAGSTWEAGRMTVPHDCTGRWGTDEEWEGGLVRVRTIPLPGGEILEGREGPRGWVVSLV